VPSVIDASALIELLSGSPRAGVVADAIAAGDAIAPELLDVEALAGIRRLERLGRISGNKGNELVGAVRRAPIRRHRHRLLLQRAWGLRHNLTAYDALYVALAELAHCPLLTADRGLASASADEVAVTVVPTRN
jgi:predicted nucleic acid-binding protein